MNELEYCPRCDAWVDPLVYDEQDLENGSFEERHICRTCSSRTHETAEIAEQLIIF